MKKNLLISIIIVCIVFGIVIWIPNLVFKEAKIYWAYSIPLGMVSLFCSIQLPEGVKLKKVFVISSIVILFSFPILMFTESIIQVL